MSLLLTVLLAAENTPATSPDAAVIAAITGLVTALTGMVVGVGHLILRAKRRRGSDRDDEDDDERDPGSATAAAEWLIEELRRQERRLTDANEKIERLEQEALARQGHVGYLEGLLADARRRRDEAEALVEHYRTLLEAKT